LGARAGELLLLVVVVVVVVACVRVCACVCASSPSSSLSSSIIPQHQSAKHQLCLLVGMPLSPWEITPDREVRTGCTCLLPEALVSHGFAFSWLPSYVYHSRTLNHHAAFSASAYQTTLLHFISLSSPQPPPLLKHQMFRSRASPGMIFGPAL
jgi:hypothetical protein